VILVSLSYHASLGPKNWLAPNEYRVTQGLARCNNGPKDNPLLGGTAPGSGTGPWPWFLPANRPGLFGASPRSLPVPYLPGGWFPAALHPPLAALASDHLAHPVVVWTSSGALFRGSWACWRSWTRWPWTSPAQTPARRRPSPGRGHRLAPAQ